MRDLIENRDERGSGSLLMVGVMIVVTVVALTATCLAGYLVALSQARSAADLAALSGAVAMTAGEDPCPAAQEVAKRNRTRLTACDRVGDELDFVITVEVEFALAPLMPGLPSAIKAQANAGPVEVPP